MTEPLDFIVPQLRPLAVEVGALTLDPENAREHDRASIESIKASFAAFKQRKPIVVRRDPETGSLVAVEAGNGSLVAARELGWSHIAAVVVEESAAAGKAYALADNRTAELSSWAASAVDVLAEIKVEVPEVDFDALGLDTAWIESISVEVPPSLDAGPAATPTDDGGPVTEPPEVDPPVDPITEPGDVWLLGAHRIACGDSTEAHVVELALEGRAVSMVFTDPPYGVGYTPKATVSSRRKPLTKGRQAMVDGYEIENDATEDEALVVTRDALALFADADALFVCCAWRFVERVAALLPKPAKACIVWDKGGPYQFLDRWSKRHEFIVYAGPYGGERTVGTDIWRHTREFRHDHPTPKPVALVAEAIRAASPLGGVVADPFLGSGATLLAAEQTGRVCVGVEVAPRYCDVAARRWCALTGKPARLRHPDGEVEEISLDAFDRL